MLRMPNKEEVAAMDRLITEVASPRTKRLLADYRQESKVRMSLFTRVTSGHSVNVGTFCLTPVGEQAMSVLF